MKAFLSALIVAGLLAFAANFAGHRFDHTADAEFTTKSVRLDQAGTVAARNFAGQPRS